MACGTCGGGAAARQNEEAKTEFVVETPGMVRSFDNETEAMIFATMHNGRVVIKKK